MKFEVNGPYELDRATSGLIDSSATARRDYWDWIEEYDPGLPMLVVAMCSLSVLHVAHSLGI